MSSATATAESLYQWWLICTAAPNKVIIRNDKHQRVAHLRTIELFRSVGIENAVRLASENQFPPDGGISAVESLAGKEIATYIANLNEGVGKYSPTVRLFMTQQSLEPVLRARAAELGATLQYSTELTSFDQDADGVTATIQD